MITILIWMLLILLVLYLGIGLGIYAIGTRRPNNQGKSIVRFTNQRLVFKDENVNVNLLTSTVEMPVKKEKKEPWNVVLVIDKSVSMRWHSALYHAKDAANNLVASTPGNFSYGIVEFQTSARICCQFTSDLLKLKQAIDKITSYGGTAIHEGLRLAYELIKEDAPPGKKNAVILLSDGGSDPKSAIQQAEELKNAEVVIYTIGLGHCHQELMKDIAGDDQRFFYADDPSKLKDFFHAVGRKIQKSTAKDVEITEYPNTSAAPFHISRWGNIRPQDSRELYHKEKPSIKWFLTGLEEEPSLIDYYMKPRCCGWYPVARHKAEIAMKNHEDQPFTFTSNNGPHILVIPRFFLWQFFWVFLNPLYWFIRYRVLGITCQEEQRKTFIKKYEKQEPILHAPAEILPPIESPYSLNINPTMVIGIGYGGLSALTHLKRLLWEHNEDEKINEKVILVGLDSVKPYFDETLYSGTIQLEAGERKNIHVHTSQYIRSESRKNESQKQHCWLDAAALHTEGIDYDIGSGTHMNPQIGRLIYLLNRDSIRELKPMLEKLYQSAPNHQLNICLTGTLGGGTSTGMMLDLSYSLKRMIKELNIPQKSINLFLMDAEPDPRETDRERRKEVSDMNKEAFKRELARFFAARDTAFSSLPEDEKIDQWFDHIFRVDKKQGTQNRSHLYPQTAVILYEWIVEKNFRDFITHNSRYTSNGLLTHRFEADAVFLYKRLLEEYFAARLLLTVVGNLILGLEENPLDYSIKSAKIKDEQVENAIDLLLSKEEWAKTRPMLLIPAELIKNPNGSNLSRFLSLGGTAGIVENTTPDEVENYLRSEVEAFENLVFAWIEFMMKTHKDRANQPFKERKIPIAYSALIKLKTAITTIKELAESISDSESLIDRKQCLVLSRLCDRFILYLDKWKPILEKWYEILGEGPESFTGISRKLNDKLNAVEKAIRTTRDLKIPHFTFNKQLKDKLYQKYFQNLEREILDQVQWLPHPVVNMELCIATHKTVNRYDTKLKAEDADKIMNQLIALPGYFASRRYEWNHATMDDFMQMSRETGEDAVQNCTRPQLEKISGHDLLFFNKTSYETLRQDIPTGIVNEKIESTNPFIHGFFKHRLNHEEFKGGDTIDFDSLPPFIFSEEWNCYNALTIYRQVTRNEAQSPSFGLVALCRDMKKFLGTVKMGIMDNQIQAAQGGARMVYRFGALKEIPQSDDTEKDILNLLREVIESPDSSINQALEQNFHDALKLDIHSIQDPILQSNVPLSSQIKTQFYQVTFGGIEYFKHLK